MQILQAEKNSKGNKTLGLIPKNALDLGIVNRVKSFVSGGKNFAEDFNDEDGDFGEDELNPLGKFKTNELKQRSLTP